MTTAPSPVIPRHVWERFTTKRWTGSIAPKTMFNNEEVFPITIDEIIDKSTHLRE
jgi:hypothetical protein